MFIFAEIVMLMFILVIVKGDPEAPLLERLWWVVVPYYAVGLSLLDVMVRFAGDGRSDLLFAVGTMAEVTAIIWLLSYAMCVPTKSYGKGIHFIVSTGIAITSTVDLVMRLWKV